MTGVDGGRVDPGLVERVRTVLSADGATPTAARVAGVLRAETGVRSHVDALAVLRALSAEIGGAGPLQPLLDDPEATDVLVHGGGQVWVDRGHGLQQADVHLGGEAKVRELAVRLVSAVGRRLDPAQPWADARLPGGHRLHVVLAPPAVDGTCLSVRLLRPARHDLAGLTAAGSVMPALADWLRGVVSARLAVAVTGATGAGKTTLLGALLSALDPGQRVVVVEDATELSPTHPHLVRLQARPPNLEGAGAVSLRDLVRQALRMRPDRLVLGEVRGPEVIDLLVAFNTGHAGGLTTVHANSPAELPARLEALAALGAVPRASLHSMLAPALQVVVHVVRRRDGLRLVSELSVLGRDRDGWVVSAPALTATADRLDRGSGYGALVALLRDGGVVVPVS